MQGIKHTTRCRGQNAFISLCGTARLGHLKLLQLQQPSSTWGCLSFYMCLCCFCCGCCFCFCCCSCCFCCFSITCTSLSHSLAFAHFLCVRVCVCVCSCCYLLLFAVSFAQELVNNFIIACGAVQHHHAATPLKYPARSRPLSVSH